MHVTYRAWLAGTVLATLALLPQKAPCSTLTSVFAIPGFNDGALSVSHLTESDGKYYGTAYFGGAGIVQPSGLEGYQTGNGVVYSINPKTGKYEIVHNFGGADGSNPGSSLTLFEGKLYGTTTSGGANGSGVLFTLNTESGTDTVLAQLPAGTYGGGLVAFNGKLYGTGETSIFSFDPASGTVQTEYQFQCDTRDGCFPRGLIVHGSYLFGTASGGGTADDGTLFQFDPNTHAVVEKHSFGAGKDGSSPNGDLIEVGGLLYGTTFIGGSATDGTIYSYDPDTNKEIVLYSFPGTSGRGVAPGLLSYNGMLYGATEDGSTYNDGTLFAFNPVTSSLTDVHIFSEGSDEGDSLQLVDGKLWGFIAFGGVLGEGALFSVDPASGNLTILHNFTGAQIAGASGLIALNGSLFGTAVGGGEHGLGSIYKVEPSRNTGQTLYSFQGSDGAYPMAPLTDVGGVLYGTTSLSGTPNSGAEYSAGTVFSFDPASRTMTTLAVLDGGALGGDAAGPLALLGGSLFGTTNQGGSHYSGTVFKLDLASGQVTTIASFPTTYGGAAYGARSTGLVAAGSLLYGTATYGGTSNDGIIFSVNPSTGALTILYSFSGGKDGGLPLAPLTYNNGLLYGSTPGGRGYASTVFSFDPATGTKTILHSISDKPQIEAAPTERGSRIYETFPYSVDLSAPYGGIIRTNSTDGGTKITILSAGPVTNPASSFLLSNDALFGTTLTSTTDNAGTVFKYVP